jgi:transcriptional regulator with XRE-family HTH domain
MDYSRDERILKEFGKNLKKIRLERKLSTRKLALIADMDFGNVNEIEAGKKNLGLTTLIALADALEVDPCALLPERKS